MNRPPITRVFYDGECGLCHRTVRFLLARDRNGDLFRFSPQQGEAYGRHVDAATRATLPASVVVLTPDGLLLTRSEAVLHLLAKLGGGWRALARVLAVIPRRWRDGCYSRVASVRRRLFAPPSAGCPLVPERWRGRFDP